MQDPRINISAPIPINTGIAGLVVALRMELPFLAWVVARARASLLDTTSGVIPDTPDELARIIRSETGMQLRRARRAVEEAEEIFLYKKTDGRTAIRSNKYVLTYLFDLFEDMVTDDESYRRPFSFVRNLLHVTRDARVFISRKIPKIRAVLTNIYQLAGSNSFISRKTTAEYLGYSRRFVINCSKKETEFITKETGVAFEPHELFKFATSDTCKLSQAIIDAESYARKNGAPLPGNGCLFRPTFKKGKCLIACQIGNRYGYSDNTTVRTAGWLAQSLWRRQNMKLPQGLANSLASPRKGSGTSQLALRTVTSGLAAYVNEVLKRIIEESREKLCEWTGAKYISLGTINYRLITLSLPFGNPNTIV